MQIPTLYNPTLLIADLGTEFEQMREADNRGLIDGFYPPRKVPVLSREGQAPGGLSPSARLYFGDRMGKFRPRRKLTDFEKIVIMDTDLLDPRIQEAIGKPIASTFRPKDFVEAVRQSNESSFLERNLYKVRPNKEANTLILDEERRKQERNKSTQAKSLDLVKGKAIEVAKRIVADKLKEQGFGDLSRGLVDSAFAGGITDLTASQVVDKANKFLVGEGIAPDVRDLVTTSVREALRVFA